MSNALLDLLAERGHLIADGAMGTNLFALGLETGNSPELWNVEAPEKVAAVHRGFLEAGSDIVLTNSFGGTAHRLKLHGAQDRVRELNAAAARVCRTAVDRWKAETGKTCLVAGSMGPTGELFEPLGALTPATGEAAFAAQAEGLAEGGADILWIETISAAEEMAAAVAGAARVGLPIVATMTFDTNARTMMGLTPADFAALAPTLAVVPSAIGANCGVGPAELAQTILGLTEADPQAVVVAKGNCGIPQYVDGAIVYDGTPEAMGVYAWIVRDAGARIVGGCCGSKPEHVRAIAEALKGYTPGERPSLERITEELGAPWSKGGRLSDHAPDGIDEEGGRRRGRRRRAG
ncbi:betaine--homocysteine S-methyltransferase [Thalassobaculum litoreum]|uniref:5-methyltetrahydrofolate--homocysteine methyltransferase n=1 Tax=Thalassobaculum litoreum DSM 18839 TaxID=1123362 RepID=A0A8G2EWS7_9PROT|nr:betaine--homocysteine S-methyltransferase [Thalassobaculum litoreum]SDF94187.1 5-methyltetrahydrofolate--homocysteine methyltransferase [Thalassobaculum litoreum DSM 18839]